MSTPKIWFENAVTRTLFAGARCIRRRYDRSAIVGLADVAREAERQAAEAAAEELLLPDRLTAQGHAADLAGPSDVEVPVRDDHRGTPHLVAGKRDDGVDVAAR